MKNIYKRRLDDQAKIFSLSCNRTDTSLFRLSTNLKQKVDKEILNQALLRTLEKYKAFKVKVRRGFFWYYLDENKKEHIVYNLCPHLKCGLIFNAIEHTWDCPCHGSRFDIDGKSIEGPSNYDISYKE